MTNSNLNLSQYNIFGNTGGVITNVEPGIPRALVLAPIGTLISAATMDSQQAFYTYVNGATTSGTIADIRRNRMFAFIGLDTFSDETKKMANVDTGLDQFDTVKFNTKYKFRYITNKANHQEALKFDNSQGQYCAFIVDTNGNWWGAQDPAGSGGMVGYNIAQIRVMDFEAYTTKDFNQYWMTIQFASRAQFNENFGIYAANIDPTTLLGLTNSVLLDVSATLGTPLSITTTTDIVCIMKSGGGSVDMVQYYLSLFTIGMFTAKNLTLGTTLTISSMTQNSVIVSGQTYYYLWFILSAAPTVGNMVQISLAAPSVTNAVIPKFDSVTEIVNPLVNGANAAVHTF